MICFYRTLLCGVILIVAFPGASNAKCQLASNHFIANSYITPFGLVTSDTGNAQWVGTADCGNMGGYVEHVQRFNGGRDNTIVGVYYSLKLNEQFSTRFALDHLDVDVPSIEVPRARLQVQYNGPVTVTAEGFYFMDKTDQRLIMWSVSKPYQIDEESMFIGAIGGSFNTGFNLQDRYYAQITYQKQLTKHWTARALYNYQHQPQHNNLLQVELNYHF